MSVTLEEKVLGCLVGAAAGDAMGAATECRSLKQILDYFGDYVCGFKNPPDDTFAQGNKAAMCTDDFWQAYFILNAIADSNYVVSEESVKKGFKKWLTHPCYENFTGPTTRAAMAKLFDDKRQSFQASLEAPPLQKIIVNDGNSKATNGGAMKIFPIGLLNPENLEKVITEATIVTSLTHNNSLAVSGACAIAASVSHALSPKASIASIIDKGIEGAEQGFERMENAGHTIAGPSVVARIKLACEIGKKHSDWKTGIVELSDIIGNGLHVSEAVPAAYGIIQMCKDSPTDAIYAGVNIGNDTDTIAIMVGSIMGAFYGIDALPSDFQQLLNDANGFNLDETSKKILSHIT